MNMRTILPEWVAPLPPIRAGLPATNSTLPPLESTFSMLASPTKIRRVDSSPGDEDSFYAPTDFGDSPDFIKQNRIRPLSVNQWNWHNVSDRLSLGWEGYIIGPYSVTNDDLGNTLQFVIGSREGGFMVDRIVLSSRASLTGVQLDVLPNSKVIPEPSTFILCCLVGLTSVGGTLRRSR